MPKNAHSTPESSGESASPTVEVLSVPELIKQHAMRIRLSRECAGEHIQLAQDKFTGWVEEIHKEQITLIVTAPGGTTKKIALTEELFTFMKGLPSPHSAILSQSLLIFGFSTFDAFVGMLLRRLYGESQNLIYKFEEKSVRVAELLNCKSIDEAVSNLIERDVSNLLRKSYDDAFGILANRHGINTLKKFASWPSFIEAAQRRNLITHCNGVVNSEYINACKKAEFDLAPDIVPGALLEVDAAYLRSSLDVLYEVGVMLAHVLWRTALTDQIEQSEELLTDEIFGLLLREEWELAKKIGEFAITIPKQKKDLQIRISRINYAQALKWSGDNEGAMKALDAVDWSGSIRDLRLGVEVLREKHDDAAKLMREIGKRGELVREDGYREWPVFREFRKTEQFKAAFKEIYGTEFADTIKDEGGANHPHDAVAVLGAADDDRAFCRR
ncbi:MAG: hypothetical protein IH987_08680 [Planctomycetes bacterium]|nr:hypothetical protein [Planctomycetota bacterium]